MADSPTLWFSADLIYNFVEVTLARFKMIHISVNLLVYSIIFKSDFFTLFYLIEPR